MNKKVIMLISALMYANNMIFTAQKGTMQASATEKVAPVAEPLIAEENKKYQDLVRLYKSGWNRDLMDENSVKLVLSEEIFKILEKRADFLRQEIRKQSSLWPYWLGASILPVIRGISEFGWTMGRIGLPLPGTEYSEFYIRGSHRAVNWTPLDIPLKMIYKIEFALTDLPAKLAPISNLVIFHVLPLMAFYGLYRKYSTKEQQLQEIREVQEITEQLPVFIRSLFPYGLPAR